MLIISYGMQTSHRNKYTNYDEKLTQCKQNLEKKIFSKLATVT